MHLLWHTGAELGIEMLLVIAKFPSPSKFTYQLRARYGEITDIFHKPGDFTVTSGIDTLANIEHIVEDYAPKYFLFINFLGNFGGWEAFFPHLGFGHDEQMEIVDFNGIPVPENIEIIDLTEDQPPSRAETDYSDVSEDEGPLD